MGLLLPGRENKNISLNCKMLRRIESHLTVRDEKDMTRGLPGTLGTSEDKLFSRFCICIISCVTEKIWKTQQGALGTSEDWLAIYVRDVCCFGWKALHLIWYHWYHWYINNESDYLLASKKSGWRSYYIRQKYCRTKNYVLCLPEWGHL